MPALCYLSPMSCRVMTGRLIQTAILSLGLSGLVGHSSEAVTNAPVLLVTNVVAQRAVGDIIQTLLEVAPAGGTGASTNGTKLPVQSVALDPIRSSGFPSNTAWASALAQARAPGATLITDTFAGFVPGSLASVIWAGFHTNGRSTKIWDFWQLPTGWPATPPVLRWKTNNLMWGRKGMTGFSQVSEGMGSFGQGTITALTRRHGYLRGHDMGPTGLHPEKIGLRVWFCTRYNQVIERKVKLLLTRGRDVPKQGDYSIVLFDADLPPGIEPMRVADEQKVSRKYLFGDLIHKPFFMPLQEGFISAGIVPGFGVPWRGGDSGAPRILPLPDELVFFGGLTTSPPSQEMQADMDMLSRQAGLDPRKYQMRWLNLDAYPDF